MHYFRNIAILIMVLGTIMHLSMNLQAQQAIVQQDNDSYLPMVFKGQALPAATATPTSVPTTEPSGPEEQMLALVNNERIKSGCPALQANPALMKAARAHSQDMADNNFFDHKGSNGSSAGDRAIAAGYSSRYVGENIAAGSSSAQRMFDAWMASSGHVANIRNCSYVDSGIGFVSKSGTKWTYYWTQDFGIP